MLKELKQKIEAEVTKLDYELRVTLPAEIKKALEFGDLRENAEYKSALERQEMVRAHLGRHQKRLAELSTLDVSRLPRDRAAFGSTLKITNLDTGEKLAYRLVMSEDSDAERGWVSVTSPIGRGLVSKVAGDEVTIRTPGGVKRFGIDAIQTLHDELAS